MNNSKQVYTYAQTHYIQIHIEFEVHLNERVNHFGIYCASVSVRQIIYLNFIFP